VLASCILIPCRIDRYPSSTASLRQLRSLSYSKSSAGISSIYRLIFAAVVILSRALEIYGENSSSDARHRSPTAMIATILEAVS